MHWYRVCVDVEQDGTVIGTSYERRSDAGPDLIACGQWYGPFDTPAEAFEGCLAVVLDREGVQMRLFT